jgi:transmembrane sensor
VNADPLERLIADWLQGTITPGDFAQLDRRLRDDPAARRALRRAANLDSALRDWATRREISAAWAAADAPDSGVTLPRARPSLFRRWRWPLAAAAAVALSVATYHFGTLSAPQPLGPATRVLADGTVVELNGAAVIVSDYTATERRIRLERGEAHFTVTKDAARPFTVTAAGVTVRAVGTAFNIRLADAAVEVLVTEGRVSLQPPPAPVADAGSGPAQPAAPERLLAARQRAVVATAPSAAAPEIAALTPGEIARVLAWQHRLVNFTATPLGEVVAAFNRRNATQLILADPALAALRVSASLRSDNVPGFVELLETGFGVRAERRGDSEILLSRPP